MPNGPGGPEGGVPGGELSGIGRQMTEEEAKRLKDLKEALTGEEKEKKWVDPDAARVKVVHELLSPAEQEKREISLIESQPFLALLSIKGSSETQTRQLKAIADDRIEEETWLQEQLATADERGVSKDTQAEWSIRIDRLRERREEVEAQRGKQEKERWEAKEWQVLHDQIEAAVSLQNLWFQRERAQVDVTTYAKGLFEASFAMHSIHPMEMVALLETPGYGKAMEKAIELTIGIHLGEEELGDEIDSVRADESVLQAAQELKAYADPKEDLADISIGEGVVEHIPLSALKVLQKKDLVEQRSRILTAVIGEKLRQEDPYLDDFEIERGVLLANHLMEGTLLTVWLAIPRETGARKGELDRWEVVYKKGEFARFGNARFQEGRPQDLTKLVLFGPKTQDEFRKGRYAGIRKQVPFLPEYLSQPYLLDADSAAVFLDPETYKVHPRGGSQPGTSILEAWYFANKHRKEKISLADVIRVSPDSFPFWQYRLWRQSRVREDLLKSTRADREDVISELMVVKELSTKRKDFEVGFGPSREIERELTKARMVAARLINWSRGKSHEMPAGSNQRESIEAQFAREQVEVIGAVRNACEMTGFLNSQGWKLAKHMYDKDKLLNFNEIKEQLGQGFVESLVRPPTEEEPGFFKRISAKDVAASLEEAANSRLHVEVFQEQIALMREEKRREAKAQNKRFKGLTKSDIRDALRKSDKVAEERWRVLQKT